MSQPVSRLLRRLWPHSLFGRLALILFAGLGLAHGVSFALILAERAEQDRTVIRTFIARDIAASIAILDRVPSDERAGWLDRLERVSYSYRLEPVARGVSATERQELVKMIASLTSNIALIEPITVTKPLKPSYDIHPGLVYLHMRLSDGTPLSVALAPSERSVSLGLPLTISALLIATFTWVAVRLAARPLGELAQAADELGPDLRATPLREDGPTEVARAAAAFNAMQRRIAEHLAERIQILTAVSHDLQTPITRMRLRVDLLDDPMLRNKLRGDLQLMQGLVEEGIEYARTAQALNEPTCRTDLHTLLDSLVYDYADAGRQIEFDGGHGALLTTRPHTLRRVVANLVDNALKFGGEVSIILETRVPRRVDIAIRDRGPGIPEAELKSVLQPFRRLESSRNRETGGTGLGLAIAHQLTLALGGILTLANRSGGGLEARLSLPIT